MSKTEVKLRIWRFGGNLFARNEVRSSKTEVNCDEASAATLSHEIRFECQKLGMVFGKFGWSGGNLFARNEVLVSKTEVKLRVSHFRSNPFARNEVRVAKTDVFLQFIILGGNIFARNEL